MTQKSMSRRQLLLGWRDKWNEEKNKRKTQEEAAERELRERAERHAQQIREARQARQRGELQLAMELYRAALRISSNDADIRRELGGCLYDLGQFIQARVEFERVLRILKQDNVAVLKLGFCLVQTGRPAKAAATWMRFTPNGPEEESLLRVLTAQCRLLEGEAPPLEQIMATVRAAAEPILGAANA